MSLANLNEYISFLEKKINSSSEEGSATYSKDEHLAKFQRKYEYAQILTAVGKQQDALEYFREAFTGLYAVKDSSIWASYFCSVGAQYAAGKVVVIVL
jgi:hypothetical protein